MKTDSGRNQFTPNYNINFGLWSEYFVQKLFRMWMKLFAWKRTTWKLIIIICFARLVISQAVKWRIFMFYFRFFARVGAHGLKYNNSIFLYCNWPELNVQSILFSVFGMSHLKQCIVVCDVTIALYSHWSHFDFNFNVKPTPICCLCCFFHVFL